MERNVPTTRAKRMGMTPPLGSSGPTARCPCAPPLRAPCIILIPGYSRDTGIIQGYRDTPGIHACRDYACAIATALSKRGILIRHRIPRTTRLRSCLISLAKMGR
jgi:hypothetical protein